MTATRPIGEMTRVPPGPTSGWLAVAGLLLLSALPVVGGLLRIGGDPENATPLALSVARVAHIVAMTVFCLLGAFQFSPALRTRHRWHRVTGRALIPVGLVAAVSSVPLGVLFGGPPAELALAMVRVVFAAAMTVFLVQAALAIPRRDFAAHGAWMTRAFAIAVSGGTQAIVVALASIVIGEVDASSETWLVGVGFVINSLIAELIIRRRNESRPSRLEGREA